MKRKKRRRGRPFIGHKETYTISEKEGKLFSFFSRLNEKKKSALIREWISAYNTKMLNKFREMLKHEREKEDLANKR